MDAAASLPAYTRLYVPIDAGGILLFYDLTYLSVRPNQLGPVISSLPSALAASCVSGTVIGCMSCDIGGLNRVAVLTAYDDLAALQADAAATLGAADPYGISAHLRGIEKTAFKPLSFTTAIKPGECGPFYEIRTYEIAAGELANTETAWAKAVGKRNTLSKLLMVMASLDTIPIRMVEIWPYKSLDERAKKRADASKMGIWPPPGGGAHVLSIRSEVFVPLPISPLR